MTRNLKWLMVLLVLAALVGIVTASTVYYLSDDASDLSSGVDFNKILNATTETAGTTGSISIAKGATEVSYAYTVAGIPNNADWTTGAATVKVNVTTAPASPYIALSMNLERINSAGTLQESATATAEQTINAAGVYTFDIASKNWTAGAATDRIRLKYSFRNIKTNGALTVTLSTGQANMGVTTEIGNLPTAAFSANVTYGCPPLDVKFTDSSTKSPASWSWYWYANETVSSTSQNPSTTFTTGTYNVRLFAANADGQGDWENKTAYIDAGGLPSGTLVVYPTVDGVAARVNVVRNDTYSNLRNGAGSSAVSTDSYSLAPRLACDAQVDRFNLLSRLILSFDTSPLKINNVSSATLYLSVYSWDQGLGTCSYLATSGTLGSNTAIAASDYQNFGGLELTNRTPGSSITGNNNSFILNNDGISYINKTSFTVFFLRDSWDVDNSFGGVWNPVYEQKKYFYMTEQLDGSVPRLEIVHTNTCGVGAVTPVSSFTTNVTTGTAPTAVLFTDTSTNTPTSWSWGAKNLTPGNNTWFQFSSATPPVTSSFGVGNWSLNLTATNSAGSNVSTQTTWLNVSAGAAVSPPVASFTVDKTTIRFPNIITCTDTSTNTPTSWEWSWGDGTSNSTTQNPSHQYTKRGKWDIYLTATNAGGSGSTATATSVKVVGYENYY